MRNHGWELPYHPLQTVAIAVFAGLAFSFYLFFIPFVGSSVLKFHIYAAFSPVVLALVIFYGWCAACDPADPGVHLSRQAAESKKLAASSGKAAKESVSSDTGLDQSQYDSDRSLPLTFPLTNEDVNGGSIWSSLGGCLCSLVHKKPQESEMFYAGEQLLYCSICDAEISKSSKHCRACDKCVAGFDHHCQWLNNCVGKKNYRLFVGSMVSALLLLVIVWATGILVLVRCFSHRDHFDEEITASLGSSFSRVPYIVVVGSLTLLALSATVPLTQLFIFHIILIHKGITTYDYILAVRDQEQGLGEGDGLNSMMSSPASSTAVSSYSSSGALALQRGMLCTPPRMFVEHQQTVLPYSSDLEANGGKLGRRGGGTLQGQKKVSVGINPWKLARISTEEAIRAAARARQGSSIIGASHVTETEESSMNSSCSVSGEISVVASHAAHRKYAAYVSGKEWWPMMKERRDKIIPEGALGIPSGPRFSQKPRSPFAGHHERILLKCSPSRFSGELRTYPGGRYPGSSCTESHHASPDVFHNSPDLQLRSQLLLARSLGPSYGPGKVLLERSRSDGYEASVGEIGDKKSMQCQQPSKAWIKTRLHTSLVSPTEKGAMWEDSPEDFMPWWSWGSRSLGSKGSRSSKAESSGGNASGRSRAEANILKHVKKELPELPGGLLCMSSDNSRSSSPSHYNSPQHNSSNLPLTGDGRSLSKTRDKKEAVSVCNGPFVSLTSKSRSGTKPLHSTQKLMDSILRFKYIQPPSKSSNNTLLEPTS